MRIVALLTVFFCVASIAVVPDIAPPDDISVAVAAPAEAPSPAASDLNAADYQTLQRTADLALEALRQSRERRLAVAQAIIQ